MCLASQAWANDLVVRVTTADGRPVADAVVMLPSIAGGPKAATPAKMEVAQKNKQFEPFVLVVPVGATVTFPNLDKFRHHVYSFSKGNKFELELYGREEKRVVTFGALGVAALGCNIHDQMVAFIRVVDTPWAEKTGADGMVTLKSVPDGKLRLSVWHPYAKTKDQTIVQEVSAPTDGSVMSIVLDVAPPK
jgi:plastocyanin